MASANHITKVAIVGAGGRSGGFMTRELLKTGSHTVTAITRFDSTSKLPEGVVSKPVDYNKHETLLEALKGQEALIITMGVFAPQDSQDKLIRAAVEAGVAWIFPNEYAPDTANEQLAKDVPSWAPMAKTRQSIKDSGTSSCFWYEWSLAFDHGFGFDIPNRTVTLYDNGDAKISVSTWPQVGRAVAGLLSLPIKAEGGKEEACLNHFKNKMAYVNSFTISQNDMLESILRVTGTKKEDWTIKQEPVKERFANGAKAMKEGDQSGFIRMMYSRVFFPDGFGNIEHKGTVNRLLGLPAEDIDQATAVGVERSKGDRFAA